MANVYFFQFVKEILMNGQFERVMMDGPHATDTAARDIIICRIAHWGLCLM
jgi:hypothetical protein